MLARPALLLGRSLLFSWGMALVALADVAGNLTIAGNESELTTIEPLARAFEKANLQVYLDVVWGGNSKPADDGQSRPGHIAVTGTEAPDLSATPIAWDGIGVLVHLSKKLRNNRWPTFSSARSRCGPNWAVQRPKCWSSTGLASKSFAMRLNQKSA